MIEQEFGSYQNTAADPHGGAVWCVSVSEGCRCPQDVGDVRMPRLKRIPCVLFAVLDSACQPGSPRRTAVVPCCLLGANNQT